MTTTRLTPFDYDALLRANIARVFNERDDARRMAAIADLWSENPVMYEDEDAFFGRAAVSSNVAGLHARLPNGTVFTPVAPAIGHHDTALLRWSAATPGETPHIFGTDMAMLADGRIDRLYVFLEVH